VSHRIRKWRWSIGKSSGALRSDYKFAIQGSRGSSRNNIRGGVQRGYCSKIAEFCDKAPGHFFYVFFAMGGSNVRDPDNNNMLAAQQCYENI